MHIQVNRWKEKRTGSRYVGCVGWDDPVYENYTYTVNCSESIIVFESSDEKREFHASIVSMKPKAQQVANERWVSIRDRHIAEAKIKFDAAMEKYELKFAEYEKQLKAKNEMHPLISWWGWGNVVEPVKPVLQDTQKVASKEYHKSTAVKTAKFIIAHPESYDLFINKLDEKTYRNLIAFRDTDVKTLITKGIVVG